MRKLNYLPLIALGVAVSGCATPEIPYDRSAENVKAIGLLPPGFPEKPTVVLASTVGQSFGLVGALVDASLEANRDSKFNGLIEQAKYSERDTFINNVTAALQMRGYTVMPVAAMRTKNNGFMAKYPAKGETSADAYLDVFVANYGYVAAGIGASTPYRPFVGLQVKLIRANDSKVLMQDTVIYNPVGPAVAQGHAVTVAPNPSYSFADFDTLVAQPDNAVKGLQEATEQTSEAISTLLQ